MIALIALAIGGAVAVFARGREGPVASPPPIVASSGASSLPVPAPSPSPAPSAASSPSAATSASAAPSARISFASSPPAVIEVDGKAMGQTPLSIPVAAGEHRIVLRPRGLGERFERRVLVPAGAAIEVRGDFNDEPSIVVRKLGGK